MSHRSCLLAGGSTRAICIATLASLALLVPRPVRAASITVNSFSDALTLDSDCTLREAVLSANSDVAVDACASGNGADVIVVPAGVYVLGIAGRNEDAATTGDLDLTEDVEISGAGSGETTIDGNDLDRVFHVLAGVTASFHDLTVRGGMVDSSGPTYFGGGILSAGATTNIENAVIEDNSANYSGGGVAGIDGSLAIRDSTIRANECNFGTGGLGCGIAWQSFAATDATMLVEGSTITANENQFGFGFAVFVHAWGDGDTVAILRNTTVAGNVGGSSPMSTSGGIRVEDAAGGGAGDALGLLENVTIVGNTDVGAYAFANVPADARIDVVNSILAESGTYDCEGNVHSLGYNVVGDAVPPFNLSGRDCVFTAAGDQVVSDPLVAPLAPNGGPTETMALLDGSPAIDGGSPAPPGSGSPACEALDQRGVTRFRCDSGAYDEGAPASCPASPQGGCRSTTRVTFQLRDRNADGAGDGDKLQWKWREDAMTQVSDFGDPTATTGYSLCVYHGPSSVLALAAEIPAASLCEGEPCWRATGDSGFKLNDAAASGDGIRSVKLKAGDVPGKASGGIKGQGGGLLYSGLPLDLDVTVQLLRSDSPTCWQSVHAADSVRENTEEAFRSKIP